MKKEKRRNQRVHINQMIEMSLGKERYINASTMNISSGGMLCKTDEQLDTYTRVYLLLTINGTKPLREISCEAVVVRSKRTESAFHTAVEFSGLNEDDKKAIDNLAIGHAGTS